MNFYALIPLFACLINLTLCVFIFTKRLHSKTSYAYLGYVGVLSIFQWFEFMIYSSNSLESAAFLLKLQTLTWIPAGALFLNFMYSLLDKEKMPTFLLIIVLSVFSMLTGVFSNFITFGAKAYGWGFDHIIGPLFLPVVFIVVLPPFLYGIYLLLKIKSKKSTTPILQQQSVYIIWGTFITILIGLISDVILPYFLKIDGIIRLTTSGIVIQTLFIYLAVRKYHFMWISIEDAAGYIFRKVEDGIILLDKKCRIIHANQAAILLLKLDYSELYNIPIQSIIKHEAYNPHESCTSQKLTIIRKDDNIPIKITQSTVRDWHENIGKVMIIKGVS